jgi:hypothetical protein
MAPAVGLVADFRPPVGRRTFRRRPDAAGTSPCVATVLSVARALFGELVGRPMPDTADLTVPQWRRPGRRAQFYRSTVQDVVGQLAVGANHRFR